MNDTVTLPGISPAKIKELEESLGEKEADISGVEASMKFGLSDLIREGCTVTDQCVGAWTGPGDTMCALSAAALAAKAHHLI